MIRRLLLFILFTLCLVSVGAQNSELERFFENEDLDTLIDRILELQITAKVLPYDQQPVWNSQSKKVTIPGRSVAVRLVGDNIRIDVVFTPYQEESGSLLLVAQGQVWFSQAPNANTTYLTTIQSIPVAWGEKVLFFPLGFTSELADTSTFNIQLEVEIHPYRDLFHAPVDD
jgi:hypothetical protein